MTYALMAAHILSVHQVLVRACSFSILKFHDKTSINRESNNNETPYQYGRLKIWYIYLINKLYHLCDVIFDELISTDIYENSLYYIVYHTHKEYYSFHKSNFLLNIFINCNILIMHKQKILSEIACRVFVQSSW
jgi:hypothetical protein